MDSNISSKELRFDGYPSEEEIQRYRAAIKKCQNPYTQDEIESMEFDGDPPDFLRLHARTAIDVLTEYGIPFEDTTE